MISIHSEEGLGENFLKFHYKFSNKLKRIELDPEVRIFYPFYNKRPEYWSILEGNFIIRLDEGIQHYSSSQIFLIHKGAKYRIENKGKPKVIFIEEQIGTYFGGNDIVSTENHNNRV